MNIISYTAARNNLASSMDRVCYNHEPLIINRSSGNSVVMLSLEDFQSIEETLYLLKSPKNAERLRAGINEVEAMIAKKTKRSTKKSK